MSDHHQERRELIKAHGKSANLDMLAEAFRNDVLPLLVDVPIAELNAATGLVAGYLTQIRTGRQTPHPHNWTALIQATRNEEAALLGRRPALRRPV